jgi:hypothetical protein
MVLLPNNQISKTTHLSTIREFAKKAAKFCRTGAKRQFSDWH